MPGFIRTDEVDYFYRLFHAFKPIPNQLVILIQVSVEHVIDVAEV